MKTEESPLLVRARDLPKLVSLSARQVRKLRACGLFPQPTYIGTTPVWSHAALREWVDSGCPPCHDKDWHDGARRTETP